MCVNGWSLLHKSLDIGQVYTTMPRDHHNHNHGHGHGHDEEHDHEHTHPPGEPPLPTTAAQSLLEYIDIGRIKVSNAVNPSTVGKLFTKEINTTPLCTDFGPELLITIPFTIPVKLVSVLITTPSPPEELKFYLKEQHDIESANNTKPTHMVQHPPNIGPSAEISASIVEHHLPRRKFPQTSEFSILLLGDLINNPNGKISISRLEIRGQALKPRKELPTSILYESAPNPNDHPIHERTEFQSSSTFNM